MGSHDHFCSTLLPLYPASHCCDPFRSRTCRTLSGCAFIRGHATPDKTSTHDSLKCRRIEVRLSPVYELMPLDIDLSPFYQFQQLYPQERRCIGLPSRTWSRPPLHCPHFLLLPLRAPVPPHPAQLLRRYFWLLRWRLPRCSPHDFTGNWLWRR